MARPQKKGLDYFPLDVDMDSDDNVQILEAKYGAEGFAVLVKLFMKIYREGYFYKWGIKESLLHAKRVNVNINTVNDIINDCIEWGLFNKDVYQKYNILTSKRIQKTFIEASKRRNMVDIEKEILLVEVNDNINLVNVDINPAQESKVLTLIPKEKKRKENKIKENNYSDEFDIFWSECPNKKSKGAAKKSFEKALATGVDFEVLLSGIKSYAKECAGKDPKYIKHPSTWLNQECWSDEPPETDEEQWFGAHPDEAAWIWAMEDRLAAEKKEKEEQERARDPNGN